MQIFIAREFNPDGTETTKEVVANDRREAAKKANVPMKYVQLQTRKH